MPNVSEKIKPQITLFHEFLKSLNENESYGIDRVTKWLGQLASDNVPLSSNSMQEPRHYFPGLKDKAWHEASKYQTCKLLEDNWLAIKDEYFSSQSQQSDKPYTQHDMSFITGTEWRAAILTRWGTHQEDAKHYPQLMKLTADDHDIAEVIMFSVVKGKGKILPHCGPWNLRLTVHLGLKIPDNCWIRVGNQTRTWQEGQCLVFDDSFEHEVANDSDDTRVILLVDIWHPSLTIQERKILQPALKLLDDDYNDSFSAEDAIKSVKENLLGDLLEVDTFGVPV